MLPYHLSPNELPALPGAQVAMHKVSTNRPSGQGLTVIGSRAIVSDATLRSRLLGTSGDSGQLRQSEAFIQSASVSWR